MLTLGLIAALLMPAPVALFGGVPLDRWPEFTLVLLLLPLVASGDLRSSALDALGTLGTKALGGALAVAIAAKIVLLVAAPDEGFSSCYTSPIAEPPRGACELSFADPFRVSGATRIDRELNFGRRPGRNQAEGALFWRLLVRDGALTTTNWNLSFFNSNRFNFNAADPVLPDRNQLPFRVRSEGEIEFDEPRPLRVLYVGEGWLRVGEREVELAPMYDGVGQATVQAPAGRSHLDLEFSWLRQPLNGDPQTQRPYASLRVEAGREPLSAAGPAFGWRVVGWLADVPLLAAGAALALFIALQLRSYLPLGLAVVGLGVAAHSVDGPHELLGFGPFPPGTAFLVPLAALLVALCLRPGTRPLLAAWAGVAFLAFMRSDDEIPYADAILYPNGGDDPLAYESQAADILTHRSLEGGEEVFYFQPGFRYVLFAGRLMFGPTTLPLAVLALAGLCMAVFFLVHNLGFIGYEVDWRRRVIALVTAVLVLGVLTGNHQVGTLRVMNSDWVPWILFPAAAALLLGPTGPRAWVVGGVLLGLEGFVRLNQWPLILVLLAAFALRLPVPARRQALPVALAVVAFALMPLAHNLLYGGEFELAATGSGPSQGVKTSELPDVFSDGGVRERVEDQLRRAFFLSPALETDARPDYRTPDLKPFVFGLELLWLAAIGFAAFKWRRLTATVVLLLLAPLAALGIYAVFEITIYYPRHMIIGVLAMALAVLYLASPGAIRAGGGGTCRRPSALSAYTSYNAQRGEGSAR